MSIHCRLFAVPEDQIAALLARPASVLGRLVLCGSPVCELPNARRTLSLLLSGKPGKIDDSGMSLLTGGMELCVSKLPGASPRILDLKEVRLLNAALQRLSCVELQRRFQQQCVGSMTSRSTSGETTVDWEESALGQSTHAFEDDWTFDQAEDFERICTQIESLKTFLAQTTGRREWLLIAMQDSE